MIRQMNIPISVDLDENAPDFAEKVKAHQASIDMAANTLDMMLLDGWREIASMPIITNDSQSIQIILFKNTRLTTQRTKLNAVATNQAAMVNMLEQMKNLPQQPNEYILGLNGDKS